MPSSRLYPGFHTLLYLGVTALSAAAVAAAPEPRASALEGDARLAKKITLRIKKQPLSDILAEIGRETGVPLTAAADVADEPAMLHVTEQPAREVLRQLALLFNYTWTRTTRSGEERYELLQGLAARREEETLRSAGRRQALAALQRKIRQETEAARIAEDPVRMARAGVLSLLAKEHWAALEVGDLLYLSHPPEPGAASLPPRIARALLPQPDAAGPPQVMVARVRVGVALRLDEVMSLTTAVLRVTPVALAAPGERRPAPRIGPLSLSAGTRPPWPFPHEIEAAVERDRQARARDRFLAAVKPWRMEWRRSESSPAGRPTTHEVLWAVAESYGVNVVADAYRQPHSVRPPATAPEAPLHEALSRWVQPGARWGKVAAADADARPFIHARRHTWYRDRLAEVPERVVKTWAARLRERGRLTLEDASALALALRDPQLRQLPNLLREEGIVFWERIPFPNLLRLYGSLTPSQRQALAAGREVPYGALTPEARRWARAHRQQTQVYTTDPAPTAGPAVGALAIEIAPVERAVTSLQGQTLRFEWRFTGGLNGGQAAESSVNRGEQDLDSLPPGAAAGGQASQWLEFRFRHGKETAASGFVLPYCQVLPVRGEQAHR